MAMTMSATCSSSSRTEIVNKRQARKEAEAEKYTIGELRALATAARDRGGMSSVNPAFTLQQTCDIYLAALKDRADVERPKAWRPNPYSRTGGMVHTRDVLSITNILRDCAP